MAQLSHQPPTNVEDIQLFLPSSLTTVSPLEPEVQKMGATERRLRVAQADDALIELRRHLRVRQALFHYKKIHVTGTGQRPNTRARAIISQQTRKVFRSAARYRAAHTALSNLDPNGAWEARLLPLMDKDIRHPSERDEDEGEGHRLTSWIWLISTHPDRALDGDLATATEEEVDQSLRVEWAKSHARTERWKEEVRLLGEEMRRVVAFLEWKRTWWLSQANRRKEATMDIDDDIHSGLEAYAHDQADCYQRLAVTFSRKWVKLLQTAGLPWEWCSSYLEVLDIQDGE